MSLVDCPPDDQEGPAVVDKGNAAAPRNPVQLVVGGGVLGRGYLGVSSYQVPQGLPEQYKTQ